MKECPENTQSHLYALDGFRGALALWVLLGHLSAATNYSIRIVSDPALAVDLFMILSGFLMFYTWDRRLSGPGSLKRKALAFYFSRYFRIAPLFYFLLLICWIFLPDLNGMERSSAQVLGPQGRTAGGEGNRWSFDGLDWFLLHISFFYGLVPGMESSSPLPEWSLSLEMQFYFLFPLLIWLFKGRYILIVSFVFAIFSVVSPKLFGFYSEPGVFAHFGQPSVLLYRANAFAAGIVLAVFLKKVGGYNNIIIWASALICIIPLSKLVIFAYFLLCLIVVFRVPIVTPLFSSKPMRFLGDISYSVYLAHMLVLIPSIYWLTRYDFFLEQSSGIQFVVGLSLVLPIALLLSYLLYIFIELPTIRFGQNVANMLLLNK